MIIDTTVFTNLGEKTEAHKILPHREGGGQGWEPQPGGTGLRTGPTS